MHKVAKTTALLLCRALSYKAIGSRLCRACPRINFVGSLCRKLCRNTPFFLQNSTKFATKAADKEPKIAVLGQAFCMSVSLLLFLTSPLARSAEPAVGPLYQDFHLTLAPGHRTEILGPVFYYEHKESARLWAVPPLFSYTLDDEVDFSEFDFVYPVLTYDRFGSEYRFQIFQLFSFAGGKTQSETNVSRFTLFPIYFQQRSAIPEKNYTAVIPFYGHLKNRLFRDEVSFVMMPIYVQSRKRDVVTDNYVYPFVHLRHGDGLEGWQFWPFVGHEHKVVTTETNH